MRVTKLQSASVVVEARDVRMLVDPWFIDGEYYGSWSHYPPFNMETYDFSSIDFIYISHIHPDHASPATLARLPKHIPVLIHAYREKFLKRNIEAHGFVVRELPHNVDVELKSGVKINVLAADDCDPELCGRFIGCAVAGPGSSQIDSLCVITDGRSVLVNLNDCPYALSRVLLPKIRAHYGKVDGLLHGYSGAGPYPQCFANLTPAERDREAAAKKQSFLRQGESFVSELAPRYYIPFAGQYTLSGRLASLDDHRGVAEMEEAVTFFSASPRIDHELSRCIPLNSGQVIDIATGERCSDWEPIDLVAKKHYRDTVLAARSFPFESAPQPDEQELADLVDAAAARMRRKAEEFGTSSRATVYVDLANDYCARIETPSCTARIVRTSEIDSTDLLRLTVDPRLLLRLLKGPRHAHWNNAEIGSHITYRRLRPYDRPLQYLLNFLHS